MDKKQDITVFGKKYGYSNENVTDSKFLELSKECYDRKLNFDIDAGSIKAAIFSIRSLVDQAQTEIKIFSGAWVPEVYENPDLINDFHAFLDKGDTALSVVFRDLTPKETQEHPFIRAVRHFRERVEICVVEDMSIKKCSSNFLLADKSGYQLAKDPQENIRDMEKFWAVFNYSNKETSEHLNRLFKRAHDNETTKKVVI